MDALYVWRVPTLLAVAAASALALFAAGVAGAHVIRRGPSFGVTAGAGLLLVLVAVGAVMSLRVTAAWIARSLAVDPALVAPGLLGYLAPALFAAFVFILGGWLLKGDWTSRRALLFYVWLLGFTAANTINWCSPGWCETIGFPLPWRSWSDNIITIGDGNFSAWMAGIGVAVGGAVDLATFAAVAYALTRARWASRPAAGP